MRTIYFYSIVLGFFGGIFAASVFDISYVGAIAVIMASFIVAVFLVLHSRLKDKSVAHPIILVSLCVMASALGAIRMEVKERTFDNNPLKESVGKDITLIGTIEDDAGATDSSARLKVYAVSSDGEVGKIKAESVLLKFPGAEFRYGDMIAVAGKLTLPENFEDDRGKIFDYTSYLKKSDITYLIERPRVVLRESGETTITSSLYAIKRWFVGNVESFVPEPESALATGVAISGKGSLPKSVKDDFVDAGLIHIVVLSGYNIAIVIRALLSMFGFAGRKWGTIVALIGVMMFVIISGGAAPVVRAAIMASITLIGTLSYTSVLQNRALFGAALVMVVSNPLILTSDASFALSFLATFAIINVVPIVAPYFKWATAKWKLREILSETIATQIFVLPYLLYQIGKFSLVAPVTNMIVLPLIPIVMLLCFVVGIVGGLGYLSVVALPIGGALYLVSHFIIWISHIFASLPFSAFNATISLVTMTAVYIIYFYLGYFIKKEIPTSASLQGSIG